MRTDSYSSSKGRNVAPSSEMSMRILFATLLTLILTAGTAHATPLHDAARDGDIDKVQMLLSSGADPNATADYEEMGELTALHLAAVFGHTDTISVLLQAGRGPERARRWRGDRRTHRLAPRCRSGPPRHCHCSASGRRGPPREGRQRSYAPQHRRDPRAHRHHPCIARRD